MERRRRRKDEDGQRRSHARPNPDMDAANSSCRPSSPITTPSAAGLVSSLFSLYLDPTASSPTASWAALGSLFDLP